MVFKPNYNHQRAERDRAKAAKKEAKLREKQEARRAAELGGEPLPAEEPEADSDEQQAR